MYIAVSKRKLFYTQNINIKKSHVRLTMYYFYGHTSLNMLIKLGHISFMVNLLVSM